MTLARWTWLFVGAQLLGVEFFALATGRELLTGAVRATAGRWMIWPALFGAVSGHFFGQRGGPPWGPFVLVPISLAVLWHDFFSPAPSTTHLELFLLFFGASAFLWGSR